MQPSKGAEGRARTTTSKQAKMIKDAVSKLALSVSVSKI